MSDVVKFYPKNAAKNPDAVLEQAIGAYDQVFIIGHDKDGKIDVRASLNFTVADIFFAFDVFRLRVMNGEYDMTLVEDSDDA